MPVSSYRGDPNTISEIAMRDEGGNNSDYPLTLAYRNDSVVRISHVCPGIVEVESRHGGGDLLILTGGIHGNEKAGVLILDRLIRDICDGVLPVQRHVLLMYGNLRAMRANEYRGARCVEPDVGITANLNRCFSGDLFLSPQCYAEYRANQMMQAVRRAVPANGRIEAVDIHQSFAVPRLCDVRDTTDRTEYTYAIVYPVKSEDQTLQWVHDYYSDIVAGAVLNDATLRHHTFAGFLAAEYGADAATFEQGTIGFTDHVTFTPQLCDNLGRSIRKAGPLSEPLGFDVWRCVRSITRLSDQFTFLDKHGNPTDREPLDFTLLGYPVIARDGEREYLLDFEERLLFASSNVPVGDRAAQVIQRVLTEVVPPPPL